MDTSTKALSLKSRVPRHIGKSYTLRSRVHGHFCGDHEPGYRLGNPAHTHTHTHTHTQHTHTHTRMHARTHAHTHTHTHIHTQITTRVGKLCDRKLGA